VPSWTTAFQTGGAALSSPPDIIGLGLATLDVLLRLEDMPTWEHGGRLQGFGLDGGGPVATACAAAARLGSRVSYLGTCGNDLPAELKMHFLERCGVDVSRTLIREEPEDMVIGVMVHAATGERVFAGLLRDHKPLQPEELNRDFITSAQFLHLDGWHREAALAAAGWMRAAGKQVCFDAARTSAGTIRPGALDVLAVTDILICGSGLGPAATGLSNPRESGRALLDMGPQIVVQTEGEEGSYTTTADGFFHTPAFKVDVVDTTGAGDVFHGAYLVGMQHGWDLETVALFATAVSAQKCRRLGGRAGIPTFEETVAFLAEHGHQLPA
jgi:sulfofructose kinase